MVPAHLYGSPGLYQLRLIADNGFCKDTTTHYIQIAAPPKAGFLADNVAGCTLLTTTFQNASINASSYVWDFGDGTFSTSKNPVHAFGYLHSPYTVKLIVFGDYGCSDTTVLTKYISVSAPPKAAFTVLPGTVIKIPDYSFTFKNQSSTDVINYRWDFGDHKSSTIENPEHTYLDTGTYKVTLIVTNSNSCTDTLIRTVQVAGVPGYLYVPNAFEPGSGKWELKTFSVRASGLSEYSLKIFNKWGELIWETTKLDPNGVPLEGWDGMMHGIPAPQGVYVWAISAKYIDGTEWKGMKYPTRSATKVGTLNLMR
jgi:PKD repeat protein